MPLTQLTRKDVPFERTSECTDAFKTLKASITNAPCLWIIDYTSNDPLELHTDASAKALGAVLYQVVDGVKKPVAFHSHRLNAAEENYSATDREMLAIIDSLHTFRHYLCGLEFNVRTDHSALTHFFT